MLKDATHLTSGITLSNAVVSALWKRVLPDFAGDGGLRDIYIQNTTITDWRQFLDYLQHESNQVEYRFGSQLAPLPTAEALFANRANSHLLTTYWAGMQINCHFFTVEEIELDFDPQEIGNEGTFKALLEFLTYLSRVLNRTVLVTHENREESAFLVVHPLGQLDRNR